METTLMSVLVWRLASFLPKVKASQTIVLVNSDCRKQYRKTSSTFTSKFDQILSQILEDLSLPCDLQKDIRETLKPLHMLSIATEISSYDPENKRWLDQKLPNVTKRILAMILFALKFHFGLDDQFEVYHSHNIKLLEGMDRIDGANEERFFDILSWIRLR